MTNSRTLARAGVLLCLLAAACDHDPTAAPPPEPAPPAQLARLECTVSVPGGTLSCRDALPSTGDAEGLIVGGQGAYVFLQASNHTYLAGDNVFSIDVTVQNLIPQALGTTDGSTLDPAGVRVFFDTEPYAAAGDPGAEVSLLNAERGFITRANQAYFQYDEVLQSNQTSSPETWEFSVPPSVTSIRFVVLVSAAVRYPNGFVDVTPGADTLLAGATTQLSATVRSPYGDNLPGEPVTWGTSDAGVATVSAAGLVTAVAPGAATITATAGARTGEATIVVCPALAVGGVYTADMPDGSSLCLGAGEYVLMPTNTSAVSSVALSVTGAGIVPVTGAPSPDRLPGRASGLRDASGPVPDDAWEARLRQRERASLPRTIPAPRGSGPRRAITPGVPAVGALMSLNVEADDACGVFDTRTGRVMAVGTHVIVVADTMNPVGGFSAAQYQAIADTFDAVVHPTVTGVFGAPSDIDGNGRVIAFYTRAVNELTPPGSPSYVGGFFYARDLLPANVCPTRNLGEMFYMLAPDPAGEVGGNERSVAFVQDVTFGTLAHEFEHLINASRRMHVNGDWNGELEETWLDEGLAHVTEELVFHAVAGTAPGANLGVAEIGGDAQRETAFFRYAEANFARLREWLLDPTASGAFNDVDDLASRGAAWAFLRYASDRAPSSDAAFFGALVNTGDTGLANLQAVLGTDPLPWYRDFVAATYGDDAGIGAAAPYTQPSWNFRALYSALDYSSGPGCTCAYELAVRNPANGVADAFGLASGGGAAYSRMGVPPGAFAGVRVLSGGVAPAATVRMTVIRRK